MTPRVPRVRSAVAAGLLLALAAAGCSRSGGVERLEWMAMGTVAAVQVRAGVSSQEAGAAFASAQDVFRRVESEFSRFDTNSVLRRTGRVTDFGRPCWEAAFALREASGGAFDPEWRGRGDFDFGAIAKGFAVDMAAADAARKGGASDLLIDLGGNVKAVRGTWQTGVRSPSGDGAVAVVALRPGEALATSAEYFRGRHVYDGRTGRPVSNEVASVTVLCGSAMWADGLSTTLFVLGADEGRRFLRGLPAAVPRAPCPVAALWVLRDGRVETADADGRFALGRPNAHREGRALSRP